MSGNNNFHIHPAWPSHEDGEGPGDRARFRKDLISYVAGLVLALALTAVPFALVYRHAMAPAPLLLVIGILALIQAVVHFRFFLHIGLSRDHADHLILVLFSALILAMMAGGTIWILGNLHSRMY